MAQPAFSNLIVTYNSALELPGLLGDLGSHASNSRVLVIDNASTDGTADPVQRQYPGVQLIRNAINVGYATAVNQGFGLLNTEYVFLLNPDIRIDSPRVFQDLQYCLDSQPGVAVAGPLQFKQSGRNRHLNFTWSYWTPRAFRIYLSYLFTGQAPALPPIRVTFLNAGCLFIRRSAFKAVGGLNEKYFLYGEEPDLFLKLKRRSFDSCLLPSVRVLHGRERSLATVPSAQRLRFKLQGALNILDALARGSAGLMFDRISGRRPD